MAVPQNLVDRPFAVPTREVGLIRLDGFVERAGRDYARTRNFDFGPGNRGNVSTLSPYIRHRLVAEEEVLRATLSEHTETAAEKFIQEVFWRTYFKGWLEQHPDVWQNYVDDLRSRIADLDADSDLSERYRAAVEGRTGIDCFDAWATELVEIGYLHNHARMWFASIWIYTLDLPWQLGADFFLQNLLDGDPASNTLGWRWVCGLHTKGKSYLARVSNITNYTEGRFNPAGQLAASAPPQSEPHDVRRVPLREVSAAATDRPWGLVVTEDDCGIEQLDFESPPVAVIGLAATSSRSPLTVSRNVRAFAAGAIADGVERARRRFGIEGITAAGEDWSEQLVQFARTRNLERLVAPYATIGPTAERLADARAQLVAANIRLDEIRRDYDNLAWPHSAKGFFKLKTRIPELLDQLGLS